MSQKRGVMKSYLGELSEGSEFLQGVWLGHDLLETAVPVVISRRLLDMSKSKDQIEWEGLRTGVNRGAGAGAGDDGAGGAREGLEGGDAGDAGGETATV